MVAGSHAMCGDAIRALQERGSTKGVRAMLQYAREAGLAGGPEARDVWRAAIVALGALRHPAEARRAFVDMRAAGAWEPSDTATVNLLLNALAGDIKVQFVRCALGVAGESFGVPSSSAPAWGMCGGRQARAVPPQCALLVQPWWRVPAPWAHVWPRLRAPPHIQVQAAVG